MSPRFVAVLLALALPALLPAATTIIRVWPAFRDAASFQRISEYAGGPENTGREIVLRTQAGERTGYYFVTRVATDPADAGNDLVLEVVLPGSPAVRTVTFPSALQAGEHVYQLGLTGADWPDAATRPAAWRVSTRTPAGATVAERASFLWTAPLANQ